MSDEITFDQITFDKEIMSGQACIRGMRIPASVIVNLVAQGQSNEEIIIDYPVITNEDIKQCLEYASWILSRENGSISEAYQRNPLAKYLDVMTET